MFAAVMRVALATPSPASWAVPRWPMIAESASRKRGSATRARIAGTASRKTSRPWVDPAPPALRTAPRYRRGGSAAPAVADGADPGGEVVGHVDGRGVHQPLHLQA